MTRHVSSIIATLKAALGIVSPSRAFADLRWDKLTIDGEPWPPATRTVLTLPPWYAARGPLEPYETPELAAAARRVRRLIRRHWWALFFEPEISTALSWLEALQQLGALDMTPQVEPGYARKFYEQVFGRADRGAT